VILVSDLPPFFKQRIPQLVRNKVLINARAKWKNNLSTVFVFDVWAVGFEFSHKKRGEFYPAPSM
jgi:hypothetical protein